MSLIRFYALADSLDPLVHQKFIAGSFGIQEREEQERKTYCRKIVVSE